MPLVCCWMVAAACFAAEWRLADNRVAVLLEDDFLDFGTCFKNGHIVIHGTQLEVVDAAWTVGREGQFAAVPEFDDGFEVLFAVLQVVILGFHAVLVIVGEHQCGYCL